MDTAAEHLFKKAIAYMRGDDGAAVDLATGFRIFLEAAKRDHARAQFNLAIMYVRGQGTEKDLAAARSWLEKARAQGHAQASAALAALDTLDGGAATARAPVATAPVSYASRPTAEPAKQAPTVTPIPLQPPPVATGIRVATHGIAATAAASSPSGDGQVRPVPENEAAATPAQSPPTSRTRAGWKVGLAVVLFSAVLAWLILGPADIVTPKNPLLGKWKSTNVYGGQYHFLETEFIPDGMFEGRGRIKIDRYVIDGDDVTVHYRVAGQAHRQVYKVLNKNQMMRGGAAYQRQ